jgi:spore maturation protein CgeB
MRRYPSRMQANDSHLFSHRDELVPTKLNIVVFGLSLTSSWGNGHATTYRSLLRGLASTGHNVRFFERDVPWYANNRDLPNPDFAQLSLYSSLREAQENFADCVSTADLVIVGSYVPEGIALGEWVQQTATGVTAFYDIDTPITLALLERGACDYISRSVLPHYDLYLSFTGGEALNVLEKKFGARRAKPLYCSVDATQYSPNPCVPCWDLGYMGTFSTDRQPALEELMLEPARLCPELRMVVAGPEYPVSISWPENVQRISHLSPSEHRQFYGAQRFTLNLTRTEMRKLGYSPSVRLFEAAACGVPIISDSWPGLEEFFMPDRDILVTNSSTITISYLRSISEEARLEIAANARARVLQQHTGAYRAVELLSYVDEADSEDLATNASDVSEAPQPNLSAEKAFWQKA